METDSNPNQNDWNEETLKQLDGVDDSKTFDSSSESYYGGNPILDYSNKNILAPMVRIGTLPFRLLALEHGADIVYTEETIALKLAKSTRSFNEKLQTVDFLRDGKPVFITCKDDHPNVLQLGAADAVSALQAAQMASRDVNGIDLNMGCPKHFSIQGEMGAALLKKPDTVVDILSTLKRNLNNSITCKIRIFENIHETIDLLRIIEKTGVSAIGVHVRYVHERPRDPCHWDKMQFLVAQSAVNVPLIVNGDVFEHEDIAKVKKETGVSSVLIARGAIRNVSIFRPEKSPVDEIVKKYLKNSMDLDNPFHNSKYTIQQILLGQTNGKPPSLEIVNRSKDFTQISKPWSLHNYRSPLVEEDNPSKKMKT